MNSTESVNEGTPEVEVTESVAEAPVEEASNPPGGEPDTVPGTDAPEVVDPDDDDDDDDDDDTEDDDDPDAEPEEGEGSEP